MSNVIEAEMALIIPRGMKSGEYNPNSMVYVFISFFIEAGGRVGEGARLRFPDIRGQA